LLKEAQRRVGRLRRPRRIVPEKGYENKNLELDDDDSY
jgi:hypothetical protein